MIKFVKIKKTYYYEKVLLIIFFVPFFGYTQQSKGEPNRPISVPSGNIIKSNSIIIDNVPIYICATEGVDLSH